ncbi:trypsin-like serine protease [Streptomyces sp. HNM0663]|uniref:Trypsin-like serine protease n=1 Tax=Streptomyces chengmaiensis TaxID=3040919 RepID=A0ABT6HWE8_9ACTN|nr:trypsin-like serine protease [Streptomyces chengmaiensis]MDH2393037.1 trypsin-like serine protease [Streptomyces chengmaiensis]
MFTRGLFAAGIEPAVTAGLVTAAPVAQAVSGTPAAAGDHAFTAQLRIGEGDAMRGCSGALVHQQWLLTASPGEPVPAGKPALESTATLGKQNLDIVEVVPRNDRDIVLVKLAQRVQGIAPVKVAGKDQRPCHRAPRRRLLANRTGARRTATVTRKSGDSQ